MTSRGRVYNWCVRSAMLRAGETWASTIYLICIACNAMTWLWSAGCAVSSQSTKSAPWWRHQMETFSALLALCAGIHRSPVNSPHKSQWRGALMFSFICTWTNGWANNRNADDLRCHRAHYYAIVMSPGEDAAWRSGKGTPQPTQMN